MKELKQSEGGLLRYRPHGKLVVEGRAEAVDAANRRGQFRLLIADPYLAALKKNKDGGFAGYGRPRSAPFRKLAD